MLIVTLSCKKYSYIGTWNAIGYEFSRDTTNNAYLYGDDMGPVDSVTMLKYVNWVSGTIAGTKEYQTKINLGVQMKYRDNAFLRLNFDSTAIIQVGKLFTSPLDGRVVKGNWSVVDHHLNLTIFDGDKKFVVHFTVLRITNDSVKIKENLIESDLCRTYIFYRKL